jgi:hypothetical protein
MQETPLPQHPNPSTPLHAILFSWSKRLWHGPNTVPKMVVSSVRDEGSLQEQMEKITVQQLATALRMNGIDGQDDAMLSSLENLALAGEISFVEYATRIQNLFARTFAKLDVTLRMKVAAMTMPQND